MQTFKHGKHTITCDSAGIFHAEHGGTMIEAGSLAGIKKKLDTVPEFVAFDALDDQGYRDGANVQRVRVVGVTKPRASWRKPEWRFADGKERAYVYADTPENHALLKQRAEMAERHAAQHDANAKEARELSARIERLTPPIKG